MGHPPNMQVELFAPTGSPMRTALDALDPKNSRIDWHVAIANSAATTTRAWEALQSIRCMASTDMSEVSEILKQVGQGLITVGS